MKNVAVFFGGQSPEHEISIITGIQAFHAFNNSRYFPIPVYVTREGLFYTGKHITETTAYKNIEILLEKSRQVQIKKTEKGVFLTSKKFFGLKEQVIDCAFLAFHGGIGEDGSFQGYCETLGLPYTGSGVLGSSLCMDKVSMKKILEETAIPISNYIVVLEKDFIESSDKIIQIIENRLPYTLFIKPANGGSSIGVSKAKNQKDLLYALEIAFSFDSKVLIEKEFIHDTEINISCLGLWDKEVLISTAEEVYSETEFLDFENKYMKGVKSKKASDPVGSKGMASTNRTIPADISEALRSQLEQHAKKAFQALHCGGVARIDFLVNKKENSFVLVEVNTIPGSLAYYLWEATGMPFTNLIDTMIELAYTRHDDRKKHTRKFGSSIFNNL